MDKYEVDAEDDYAHITKDGADVVNLQNIGLDPVEWQYVIDRIHAVLLGDSADASMDA
jgi:hypothetical protein